MVRAMDRTRRSRRISPLGFGLFCAIAVGATGCSQLRGSRSEGPKLGSTGPASYDPYLAHHQAIHRSPSPAELASTAVPDLAIPPLVAETSRSTAHPTVDPARPSRSAGAGKLAIDLGPPAAVPPARNEAKIDSKPSATKTAAVRTATKPDDALAKARELVAKARVKVDGMASYQVQINRIERVGGQLQPAEDVWVSIRREPKAVRLEWRNGSHKGREVIYSKSDPSGMMHVNLADSLVPVPKLSIPPDSPMVMKMSRHPITEAGFDTILGHIEATLSTKNDGSKMSYDGLESPPAVGRPCHKLTRQTANGETWVVHVDAETELPAMVQATSGSGELLEKYVFKDVKPNPPELANASAFDPNQRWGSSLGLLGRLARASAGDKPTAAPVAR